MKTAVKFVHLHTPFFFAGKNWKEKVSYTDKGRQGGKLTMTQDSDTHMIHCQCEGDEFFLYPATIIGFTPLTESTTTQTKEVVNATPTRRIVRSSAQVSGPHDHVFAGNGAGKTNDR